MPSTDRRDYLLGAEDRKLLLRLADQTIRQGVDDGTELKVDPDRYSLPLQRQRASFVTLHLNHRLRGCIGHLEACQPLVADVVANAFSAAFRDPRFQPLQAEELPRIELEISILSPPLAVEFSSEQDLLSRLSPGADGLILELAGRRATFLPSVWESLPQPVDFLRQLKMKAGFSSDYWSDSCKAWIYQTESFTAQGQS